MKVEVQFLGNSVDVETYEAEHVEWIAHAGYMTIYVGTEDKTSAVAAYPEHRIVSIRGIA